MTAAPPLRLFEGYGVELEYILVSADTLDILPIADWLLQETSGTQSVASEADVEGISWSNELVLHLIELKNTDPAPTLAELPDRFQEHVASANRLLGSRGAQLMPSGMHPWMRPRDETRLWPHEGREIYETFHRIFDCHRHGWANLQSAQLNLSFGDDEEFGRLHAAIRLLLPILPALAASSPICEGQVSGLLDKRLDAYATNARDIPSISGDVVPEPVFSRMEYERSILDRMYRDISRHDDGGVLRHEWLNARGAIAHFDRDAIEIRVLDMQECPAADVAICSAVSAVVKELVSERWVSYHEQRSWEVEPLSRVFLGSIADGERALIDDRSYLQSFGFPGRKASAGELWQHLEETLALMSRPECRPLQVILAHGPLARRILDALQGEAGPGARVAHEALEQVYRRLCGCLALGEMFVR
jgi:gamma-glutamyl:cysteine ligase YbdK (ATP-grasp superfamily)